MMNTNLIVASAYFQEPEPPCTAVLEGIEPSSFQTQCNSQALCVHSNRQLWLWALGHCKRNRRTNFLGLVTNLFLQAGLFFRSLFMGLLLSLKSHSRMILLILICLCYRSPSKQSGKFLGTLNAFNFIFNAYIHFYNSLCTLAHLTIFSLKMLNYVLVCVLRQLLEKSSCKLLPF